MSEPVLQARGLSKRYEGTQALDSVDLTIDPGEVVALLGKNGAGKSTLIKILAGHTLADSGRIRAGDHSPDSWQVSDAQRVGFHFMFQELEQFDALNVAENVMLGSPPRVRCGVFLSDSDRHREARSRFEAIGVDIDTRRMMDDLTVIEKRFVMIARALGGNLRLLVLDEPTAALTAREVEEVLSLCRALRDRGVAILYVTHRLSEVVAIADRAVILKDGANQSEVPAAGLDLPNLVNSVAGERPDIKERWLPSTLASETKPLLELVSLSDGEHFFAVSFAVRPGECLGIGGLAGSGRSELVRSIVGDRPVTSGAIRFDGEDRRFTSIVQSLAAGVVLLPEERRAQALIGDYSVRFNMTLSSLNSYRQIRGLPFLSRRREREAVNPYVARLAMKIAGIEQDVAALSGGTQQKVVTARALLSRSSLIIMDEPTAGIDILAKEEIYGLVDELKAQGKAILVIASDFAELVRMSDQVITLSPEGYQTGKLDGNALTESAISRLCFQVAK
jgi:ABC-type sugar transport system ATPase subunit